MAEFQGFALGLATGLSLLVLYVARVKPHIEEVEDTDGN